MTDEKYIFTETERDRKRTARGAYAKKGGRGSRKVHMPSDYLSRKEREQMNGEVKSNKLNEPMSWKEFKKMPDDIQAQYLRGILERFDPEMNMVARLMKCSACTLSKRMKELGVRPRRGGSHDPDRNDAFLAWWNGITFPTESGGAVENTAEPEEPKEEVKAVAELPGRKCYPSSGRMILLGNPAEIAETIAGFLGDKPISCTVEWSVCS